LRWKTLVAYAWNRGASVGCSATMPWPIRSSSAWSIENASRARVTCGNTQLTSRVLPVRGSVVRPRTRKPPACRRHTPGRLGSFAITSRQRSTHSTRRAARSVALLSIASSMFCSSDIVLST